MDLALWSTIRELRMAGIQAADLKPDAFESLEKHAELVALIAAYEKYLTDRRIADIPAVYEYAPQRLDYCPIMAGDLWTEHPDAIWAPLQRKLLDSLPGERVMPRGVGSRGLPQPRRWPMLKRDIEAVAPSSKTDAERLAFLMRPADAPAPANDGTIAMFRAGGRESEVDEVFRRIMASGAPLDHVEIACASAEYTTLIWEKACRYDWPVKTAAGIPAALTRPGRALLAWCDWIEGDFAAVDLRHLLQSGDIALGEDAGVSGGQAASLLARAGAAWGRDTYRLALTRLEREYISKAEDPERTADLQQAAREKAQSCARLREWIESLIDAVPQPVVSGKNGGVPRLTLRGMTEAAVRFLDVCAASTKPHDQRSSQASVLDAAARRDLLESVAGLHAIDDLSCSLAEALGFIRERVASVTIAVDRPRPGALHISTLSQCAYAGRPHLFIVGLEEGKVFPAAVEDPVLLDEERAGVCGGILRSSEDCLAETQHQIVTRIASAGGRVCLSYSCRDTRQYRESLPSWILLQAARLATGDHGMNYDGLARHLGEPVSPVPHPRDASLSESTWWVSSVRHAGQRGLAVVESSFPSLARGRAAQQRRDDVEAFTEHDGFVPAAGPLLDPSASGSQVSATTLEAAAKCPFRYFLKRGLSVEPVGDAQRERDLWLGPLLRGSELHALYAALMRRCRKENRNPDLKKDKWLVDLAVERLDQIAQEMPPPSKPVFDREREEFLRDVELFIEHESKRRKGDPKPIAFEVAFGRRHSDGDQEDPLAQNEPVVIKVGTGREIRLNGRIDRIDEVQRGVYDIIDYKTGGFWRDDWKGEFAGGAHLQHALYGRAAMELLAKRGVKATIRQGVYFFSTVKGGKRPLAIKHPAFAKTCAVVSDLLDVMASGTFVHTDTDGECRFCEFGNACGAGSPDRAAGKIANEKGKRLEAVRRLAGHE
jgi:ATP-dependent helicase/nuclease subunit B